MIYCDNKKCIFSKWAALGESKCLRDVIALDDEGKCKTETTK